MSGLPYRTTLDTMSGTRHARKLGVPTINLILGRVLPPLEHGIYSGWLTLAGERQACVIHFGPRPMLGDPAISLEAHVLDAEIPMTPKTVTLEFIELLRPISRFSSEATLKAQILQDIEAVKRSLGVGR